MARVSIANHAKLSWLLLRGGLRRLAGRLNGHPLLRWPLPALKADRLLIAPQDLRTADATLAAEIYSGRFAFAGKVVVCDERSVFEMAPPSEEWAIALLGFGWLRHLRAAESGITRANARALIDEWITLQGSWHPLAWRPDVLSRRVISWLSQAALILQDADVRFYRRFLRSLVRQVRYLRATAGDARRGVARLQATIALAYATLCIAGQARHIKSATERLKRELEAEILPDGGHVSRDPGVIIEVLLELLPLRQVYASRNIAPPPALLNAIDRMMPMLRFFRHSEGTFAHFNGMGVTPAELLLTLLAYDETHGAPLSNASYSGYQRLEAGGGVLIMDSGRAPPLEMSLRRTPAACRSNSLRRGRTSSSSIAACRQPRAKSGGRWRAPPRRIRRSRSTTLRPPNSSTRRRSGGCWAARRCSADRAMSPCRARSGPMRSCCARPTTATPPVSASCMSARWCWRPMARGWKARICSLQPTAPRRCAPARTGSPCVFICTLRSRRRGSPTATACC
jgi:uncharacterized heparinase superfamily protein